MIGWPRVRWNEVALREGADLVWLGEYRARQASALLVVRATAAA
jgi:hypothetical protein